MCTDFSGNDDKALVYAKKYLQESIRLYGKIHPESSFAHDRLAMCLLENNETQLALQHAVASSDILFSFLTKDLDKLDETEKFKFVELALNGRKPLYSGYWDAQEISISFKARASPGFSCSAILKNLLLL